MLIVRTLHLELSICWRLLVEQSFVDSEIGVPSSDCLMIMRRGQIFYSTAPFTACGVYADSQ
jgi:hypothetical protein